MPRRIKPYTKRWEKLADEKARECAPEMLPCAGCGYPNPKGIICTNCDCDCGSTYPDRCDKGCSSRSERPPKPEVASLNLVK